MEGVKSFFQFFKCWYMVQPWELALRVRLGKKIKEIDAGFHFRIPYFDFVFVQEKRLRVVAMPIQTLYTKDGKVITISGSLGYSIRDLEVLFNTLYQPQTTIINIAMNETSMAVMGLKADNINIQELEELVIKKLNETDYGLDFHYYKTVNFAVLQTFRVIKDTFWIDSDIDMNKNNK